MHNYFSKSLIDLKSTQNITVKYLGLYVKHCLHACKCSFSYFHHYIYATNKQSNRYSLYGMTSVVVLFAYPVKLNISTRKGVTEILPKKLYNHFNGPFQCNQENVGQNFVS